MKTITVIAMIACLTGCARFTTLQTDTRTNEKTGEKTTITTKAASWTFFDSKSSLAKWKATQSEKSQGASVGGLDQSSSATNLVTISGNAAELGRMLRPTP